ncbi:MAG: class I SAM-dependent methyltransferase [Bacteroidia bacterium]|nr:class I SAM-dependent methyltransferase [Bacteroidia bacterium]
MKEIEILLDELEIIDKNQVEIFFRRVRDRNDVQVMRCRKSGVIYLSSSTHMSYDYYKNLEPSADREIALKETYNDDFRRFKMFYYLIKGRSYLDVGTGLGGILDLFKEHTALAHGVELQKGQRELLIKGGHTIYESIKEVPSSNRYDIVSLFHVFEHLLEPMVTLMEIRELMNNDSKIIIEVPHANDFLFNQMDLEAFKEFTFWSEHLILHTKESLTKMLEVAGFKNIKIENFQRYLFPNHLYWIRHNKPGGHKIWSHLSTDSLNHEYCKFLSKINQTDTIIATATKL